MDNIKQLLDEFGIISRANEELPTEKLKLDFVESLSELEDNTRYKKRDFPKTRLHKMEGIKESVFSADINKTSGWRIILQLEYKKVVLKDLAPRAKHDKRMEIIKSKKNRYN